MAELKKKIKCDNCGMKFFRRRLRCPHCDEPNPHAAPPMEMRDRWFGIILLVLGVASAIPVVMFFVHAGTGRGLLLRSLLTVIPLGLIFHGALFLLGIYPKDFYEGWDHLSELTKNLIIGGAVALGLLILILFFALDSGGGRIPEDLDDEVRLHLGWWVG